MKRFLVILTVFVCLHFTMQAQQNNWQYYYEQMIACEDDDNEEGEQELIFEILSEIAENPININTITREQMEDMLFLNDSHIDAVVNYIRKYGPMRSNAEWMMVGYLDDNRRGLLRTLTYLGEPEPKVYNHIDTLSYNAAINEYRHLQRDESRGELTFSTRIPFYNRKGDGNAYHGGKIKQWLRFNYKPTRHLKVGFVAAQDAGEPFFKDGNRWGYDFYSAYLQVQKLGMLKNLVIGNYRLRSGLGLILNSNYTFGKTFSLSSIQNTNTSLRPHSSRSEGNYLQGVAATVALTKQLEATVFGSYRQIDATLTNDDTAIATILKTGYHRTTSELTRKHNAEQASAGANIHLNHGKWHFGATGLWNHYSLPLLPYQKGASLSQLYRMFMPAGQDFWNVSVDYGYQHGKLLRLYGETATGDCGKIATVNTASLRINDKLTLLGIQRFYPYQFYATMGRSFSEGGSNQDESGVYVGATWNPNTRLSLTAYTDIAYFVWPKYEALGSSHSFDNLIQLNYKLSPYSSLTVRYRGKLREKDAAKEAGYQDGDLIYKNEQRLRVSYLYNHNKLSLKSQADVVYSHYKISSTGWMFSQTAAYRFRKIDIAAGANYFNTDDYNSRVYAYEQSTPYNLSFPTFYGKGIRVYALGQYDIMKKLSVIAKMGLTHYFDRNQISSGYQLIDSSTQTDLDIMIRWKI